MSMEYDGQPWEICPTKNDCNSFFHAVFGEKINDACYTDQMASNRRMHWTTFLSYYETRPRPEHLRRTLRECFEEHGWNPNSDADYKEYVKDVESERQIRPDELEMIASLENVAIVLLKDIQSVPQIIRPVPEMLESYPLTSGVEVSDAAVILTGTMYSKLIPKSIESADEGTKEVTKFRRYPGFIAGILYEINLLTVVLLNALGKYDNWRLSADNAAVEYFDDVILEWGPQNQAFLLQAKRRQKSVYDGDLLGNKYSGFSLCKYFLAYRKLKSKFKVKNVVLCTNAEMKLYKLADYINQRNLTEDDPLYLAGLKNCICLTFKDEFAHTLLMKVYEHASYERNYVTEEDIKAFLKDFQLLILPWKEKAFEQAIEEKIFSMGLSGKYDKTDYARYLNKKITQWYDKSSRYLTPLEAKVIFCGLKSDKLVEKLNNMEMEFKPDKLSLPAANRVLHLVPQNDVLSLLRVCKTLQTRKSQVLFLSTRDSVDNQKLMAEAFEYNTYSYLVIYVAQLIKEEDVQELCDRIVRALNKFEHKKVILIGDQGDRLAEQLKKYNNKVFEMVEDNITFTDFSEKSREELLEKAILSCEASL